MLTHATVWPTSIYAPCSLALTSEATHAHCKLVKPCFYKYVSKRWRLYGLVAVFDGGAKVRMLPTIRRVVLCVGAMVLRDLARGHTSRAFYWIRDHRWKPQSIGVAHVQP